MAKFERRSEPLLSKAKYYYRLAHFAAIAGGIVAGALAIGIIGYHTLVHLSWIDSLLNASMILGGMGPVNPIPTVAGKIFASIYALFSGMVFIVAAGILFAPIIHRFFHHFHLEMAAETAKEETED